MKTKIEQERLNPINITSDIEGDIWVRQFDETVFIEKSKSREVAKAICPEYQKVIDQNAKLVEALEEAKDINFDILCLLKRAIYFIDMTDAGYSSNLKQEIIKALQNNKKIEG